MTGPRVPAASPACRPSSPQPCACRCAAWPRWACACVRPPARSSTTPSRPVHGAAAAAAAPLAAPWRPLPGARTAGALHPWATPCWPRAGACAGRRPQPQRRCGGAWLAPGRAWWITCVHPSGAVLRQRGPCCSRASCGCARHCGEVYVRAAGGGLSQKLDDSAAPTSLCIVLVLTR